MADELVQRGDLWCSGLSQSGERMLVGHERARLRRRIRRRRTVGLVAVVAAPLAATCAGLAAMLPGPSDASALALAVAFVGPCAIVGLGAALVAGSRPWRLVGLIGVLYLVAIGALGVWTPTIAVRLQDLTTAVAGLMLVLGLGHGGALALRPLRILRRARLAADDLHVGVVAKFAGRLASDVEDRGLSKLLSEGYVSRDATDPQRLELLPRSSIVVRANGRIVEPWVTAHVARLAKPQVHALRVALPEGLIRIEHDPTLRLQRRPLSPIERDELEAHAVRLRGRRWPTLTVSLVTAAMLAAQLTEPTARDGALLIASVAWYAMTLSTYFNYARRVTAARRLGWDRDLRWVVTVHDRSADDGETDPRLEVLPISQLAWTEDARPATWRSTRL